MRALADNEPLQLLERDETAEQRCLQQLCCWAYSITPSLFSWQPDCLQLEIGGCLNLFQGLDSLLAEVDSGVGSRGYSVMYGLAPTPKSRLVAVVCAAGDGTGHHPPLTERLAPLPLELLDGFPSAVDSLRRAGLHTMGDILALPGAALGRRCGREFSHFLQQLLGQREDMTGGLPAAGKLQRRVLVWLRGEGQRRANAGRANTAAVPVRFPAQHTAAHRRNLLAADMHRPHRAGSACAQRQQPQRLEKLAPAHNPLLRATATDYQRGRPLPDLHHPVARAAGEYRPVPAAQPARAAGPACWTDCAVAWACRPSKKLAAGTNICRNLPCMSGSDRPGGEPATGRPCAQRPFWLMPQPKALQQSREQLYWNGALTLLHGPERIEDNWWQDAVSRDYYVASR